MYSKWVWIGPVDILVWMWTAHTFKAPFMACEYCPCPNPTRDRLLLQEKGIAVVLIYPPHPTHTHTHKKMAICWQRILEEGQRVNHWAKLLSLLWWYFSQVITNYSWQNISWKWGADNCFTIHYLPSYPKVNL